MLTAVDLMPGEEPAPEAEALFVGIFQCAGG
jgi:hypothetical protein